jgi:sulfate/thiosulfate-binding protein
MTFIRNLLLAVFFLSATPLTSTTLFNVSYDPTREFYKEYNALFQAHWQKKTGASVKVQQSHGGSGKQARSVIEGLRADVVTLALGYDIDAIAKRSKKIPLNWQSKLPHNSAPYTSTIVFVVRKGNPKQLKDWDDLAKPGVTVITPNPKTSGGARWNYLAMWGYAQTKWKDPKKTEAFVQAVFKNVPVLDSGARGSATTFTERKLGDVLISWENEAYLIQAELGQDNYTIIYPSISILAEPSVAVVEENAIKNNNLDIATEYLAYLYTPEAQALISKHYFRPREKVKGFTPHPLPLFTIADLFKNWDTAHDTHFKDGGTFDRLYSRRK